MTKWYTINHPYGDYEIVGPFKSRKVAEMYRVDSETAKPKRAYKGNYETPRSIVAVESEVKVMGYANNSNI